MPSARHRSASILVTTGSACLLLAGMAVFSDEVRRHVANLLSGDRSGELAKVIDHVGQVTRAVVAVLGDYRATHEPLVAFGLVALVLFVLMIRS